MSLYARRESTAPCRVSLALPEAPVQDLLVWGAGAEEGGRGTADVLRLVRVRVGVRVSKGEREGWGWGWGEGWGWGWG